MPSSFRIFSECRINSGKVGFEEGHEKRQGKTNQIKEIMAIIERDEIEVLNSLGRNTPLHLSKLCRKHSGHLGKLHS